MHTEECKKLEKEYKEAMEDYNRIKPLPITEPLGDKPPAGGNNLKDILSVKRLMNERKAVWEQYCKRNCK
jgi:hypothetical protein